MELTDLSEEHQKQAKEFDRVFNEAVNPGKQTLQNVLDGQGRILKEMLRQTRSSRDRTKKMHESGILEDHLAAHGYKTALDWVIIELDSMIGKENKNGN